MRYRYKLQLDIDSNSKKECVKELEDLIETLKDDSSANHHFSGANYKTIVQGYIKKPAKKKS